METHPNEVQNYIDKKRRGIGLIFYVVMLYCIYAPFMYRISLVVGEILQSTPDAYTLYISYLAVLGVGLMVGAYLAQAIFKDNSATAGALISLIW